MEQIRMAKNDKNIRFCCFILLSLLHIYMTSVYVLNGFAVVDPGFSRGGCANSQKCYYFSIFLPKTA